MNGNRNRTVHWFLILTTLAFVSCVVTDFDDYDDDEDFTSCREALEKIYLNCDRYFEDSLGDPFKREDAIDACRMDEVFSRDDWDCLKECVNDNQACQGIEQCVEEDCEMELAEPED